MTDQLKRILNLVRKTGDTMIVTDPNGDDVYVVMGLDQYEDLRNETGFDEEMFDHDRRGAALLADRSLGEGGCPPDWDWGVEDAEDLDVVDEALTEKTPDIWSTMQSAGDQGETWDLAKLSEDESLDLEEQYKKYAQEAKEPKVDLESKNEEIPPKLAENEDEFGEEQFYLEPIE